MADVLIIDDDEAMCRMLVELVKSCDHHAQFSHTLQEGLKTALSGSFDVLFLDVNMPDGSGLDALAEIRNCVRPPEVIIITGAGDPDSAEVAIRNGAWDFLQKPLSPQNIILPLNRVLQYRDNIKKAGKSTINLRRKDIVGNSPRLMACLDLLANAANSSANVLITGETGTGKDIFAKCLHQNSDRADKNFVVVDCATLPQTLIESTLFGHKKGAFTGAVTSYEGLIKLADQGTLFLDEVCELSPELQKTFLRVLQEKRFRPVGGEREISSNFRLVAATNRDPDKMVENGLFRKDLLYRLRAISVELPTLRDRMEDIKPLILHYLDRICTNYEMKSKGLSHDFIDALSLYDWPGNIRELIGALESAAAQAKQEPILFPMHLPKQIRIQMARASVIPSTTSPAGFDSVIEPSGERHPRPELPTYKQMRESVLAEAEKEYFQHLMAVTKGSTRESCRISNLGRTRLYTLMKKYNIPLKLSDDSGHDA